MNKELEMDQTILKKNLEITKLTQQVDSLITDKVDLNVKLDNYAKEIVRLTLKLEENER
jgi:hypothetical protein